MPNNYFKFKKFTIQQEHCAMKVGTDGVLLGAWINSGNAETILDIGTGTGLIALMLAQRSNAKIDAIDIDSDAIQQAIENFKNSPWNNQLRAWHKSFQNYLKECGKYDLLVSNPPYFSNSLKAPDEKRSNARHDHLLSRTQLLDGAIELMTSTSRLGIILPTDEYNLFYQQFSEKGFFEIRKTFVIPKPGNQPSRIMAEISFKKEETEISELIIEKHGRHHYSEEYIELTKEYYLRM